MSSRWLLWMVSLLFTVNVNALNVIPQVASDGTRAHVLEEQGFIELAPANASGISYNKFHVFDQESSPLRILNAHSEVDLIILEAPDFILDSDIKLIGKSADILLLSQDLNSLISCDGCSFNAFSRVTLAAASWEEEYDTNIARVGNLNTLGLGRVSLNNLYAPDVLIVETLSRYLSVDGKNSVIRRVSKDSAGGYVADDSGELTLSGGSLSFNSGRFKWDYDSRTIVVAESNSDIISIKGKLESPDVKIVASSALDIEADVDTEVDVLSSAIYRGEALVPSASVVITGLSTYKTSITGEIFSSENVGIYSNGDVAVAGIVQAGSIEIVAAEGVVNEGQLEANEIKISSREIVNRSSVLAEKTVRFHGSRFVGNEYGGSVSAHSVSIKSPHGLVRNGSRTPYLTNDSSVKSLISDHSPVLDPSGIEGGMYYSVEHDQILDKVKVAKTSAKIYGNYIHIEAAAVENINPYWLPIEYVDKESADGVVVNKGEVSIDSAIAGGVLISAIHGLLIEEAEYIYNSSAIIETVAPGSMMDVRGGLLLNERYRRMSLLGKNYYEPGNLIGSEWETSIDKPDDFSVDFYTKSYVYSPPGRILIAGKAFFDAQSAVVNNVSFLESLGDVKIVSPSIRQIGHKNRKYNQFRLYESIDKAVEGRHLITHDELDSLFRIGGVLYADSSVFDPVYTDAFSDYIEIAGLGYVQRLYEDKNGYPEQELIDDWEYEYVYRGKVAKGIIVESNFEYENTFSEFLIQEDYLSNFYVGVSNYRIWETYLGDEQIATGVLESKPVDEEVSVLDVLNDYYENMRHFISDKVSLLQTEISWWN